MMLLNCVLRFSVNGAYVFIKIILLLSNLECSGTTLLYRHPLLRLHPFMKYHHPPLTQRCQLFHNCRNQDQKYFSVHNTHNFQTNENVEKESLNIGQQTLATVTPYFPRTIGSSTESLFSEISNDNYFVKPITNTRNVLHHPVHGGRNSHLNTLLTTSSNHVPDLSNITANKINKLASHLLNTERHIHETHKLRRHDHNLLNNTDLKNVANDIPENISNISKPLVQDRQISLLNEFRRGLDKFERKFYMVTFKKLTAMTAGGPRSENSISFVQSALFLQLLLLALSIDGHVDTKAKIDSCIGIENNISNAERIQLIKEVVAMLPNSTDGLVFRWSSHLVLDPWWWYNVSEHFKTGATALQLHMDQLNGTETPQMLSALLNRMVEEDSKGAIHNTFDPADLSGTVMAMFLTTLYLRSNWRTAPTLLNGTRIFRDSYEDPNRTIRMIRVNDMMQYADLTESDAEAVEVSYLKPGLSLLILVPHGTSLRRLADYVAAVGLSHITSQMRTLRVAADLPLYTLRMSLLLPNKVEDLGLSNLLHVENTTDNELKMSHGIQRLMFWAEAGRNAFKDDGLEWDEPPHMKIVIDRPYLFFVRWNNITLMNGNFVL